MKSCNKLYTLDLESLSKVYSSSLQLLFKYSRNAKIRQSRHKSQKGVCWKDGVNIKQTQTTLYVRLRCNCQTVPEYTQYYRQTAKTIFNLSNCLRLLSICQTAPDYFLSVKLPQTTFYLSNCPRLSCICVHCAQCIQSKHMPTRTPVSVRAASPCGRHIAWLLHAGRAMWPWLAVRGLSRPGGGGGGGGGGMLPPGVGCSVYVCPLRILEVLRQLDVVLDQLMVLVPQGT